MISIKINLKDDDEHVFILVAYLWTRIAGVANFGS
jgi:hypothetical protein